MQSLVFKNILLIILGLMLFSCSQKAPKTKEAGIKKLTNVIEVIDFYTTHRCVTCIDIENNTKYTLDTYFKREVASHKIVYLTLNIDKKENYKIAEKFQAIGSALFLNVISKGKETPINLTDFAFLKGSDKDIFVKELKSKIDDALKKL